MRLLFSKPDSLGDQLIAAGPLQALRALQPGWRIVWHVRAGMEAVAPLIGAEVFFPRMDADPTAEAARLAAHPGSLLMLPYSLSSYEPWTADLRRRLAWWADFLRATAWDATVLGLVNRTWVGDVTVMLASAPVRIGCAAHAMRQPLVNEARALAGADAPDFTVTIEPSFDRSEAAQLRDLLAALEPRLREGDAVPIWQPAAAWQPPAAPPASLRVLIAPGVGGDPRRAWGLVNFRQVAAVLRDRGATVAWIEGPGDAPYLQELSAKADEPRHRFGTDDLAALADTLRQADLLLCHDTAYVHLAAGLGVPTVALYGAGQGGRFHPAGGRIKIVQGHLACAGCQWHCLFDRLACVADLPVDRVLAAVDALLTGDRSTVTVELPLPVASASGEEEAMVRRRLQEEILALNADRFARLQIIQNLVAPVDAPAPPPPAPEPRLSVIIPMGRPDRVAPTLASLAAQSRRPAGWEVVLVGVEAATVAQAHPHLPVVPVVLAANQLPPRTRCLGVERASGDWYLFIDDDVELAPDVFARFLEFAMAPAGADRPIGAIGLRLPGKSGRYFERVTDFSNFWAQQDGAAEDREWLYSAAIFVRTDAYRVAGGFNPDLPNGEDVDLTQRIAGEGYRLRYEPSLVARHDHRRDTMVSMWRYFWRNGNAARHFFAIHGGACCFCPRAVLVKTWHDWGLNRDFRRRHGERLGTMTPWVILNYLIVECSLEVHYQRHLRDARLYETLPARTASDRTYVRAMRAHAAGRGFAGTALYTLAVLQSLADPVRR